MCSPHRFSYTWQDLNELDHLHWDQDDEYDFDGDHVIIKEGYAALSSRVAATLDIRLNTEVKMIRLDDAQSNVEVVVNSEGKDTTLRAGYVVVTLPLGVLKSRLVSGVERSPVRQPRWNLCYFVLRSINLRRKTKALAIAPERGSPP